jgi:sugar/nucleoside kinase (ribokinase family)
LPTIEVPAVAVDVIDATGAGDAFAGTLCSYLARDTDLVEAVRLANVVASIAVATPGSHLGPIDPARIERLRRLPWSAREVSPQP